MATFRQEAAEHIAALASGVVELERAPDAAARTGSIEAVFRAAHSLKGAARAVNASTLEALCQSAEGVLAAVKRGSLECSPRLLDLLHEAVDALEGLVAALETNKPPGGIAELMRRLDEIGSRMAPREPAAPAPQKGGDSRVEPAPAAPVEGKAQAAQVVRIEAAKLDALLRQAEEMVSAKLAVVELANQLREVHAELAGLRRARSRRALLRSKPRPQEPADDPLKAVEARLQVLAISAQAEARALGTLVDTLLADTKKALMLPISAVLEMFPRLVRDLARDQGKEVELVVRGANTEVDRRILEEMRDPLVHLLRNSVDHGIEAPDQRRRAGKQARGRITLEATPKDGNQLEIVVADDGAGIDLERLRAAARSSGALSAEAIHTATAAQLLPLVFASGVSTSPMITDISGRGLGLAIVADKAERLGGSVHVESWAGKGTSFHIKLPLTLSTFRGVHVRIDDRSFVLPTAQVVQVARVARDSVRTVQNRSTISWSDEAVPLIRLAAALGIPAGGGSGDGPLQVLIVAAGERRIALAVDAVLGEQEVLVKPLPAMLPHLRNMAGITVLGNGTSVPILHVPELVRSAIGAAAAPFEVPASHAAAGAGTKSKSILVAEDSVTSRALLKNILETAGYRVVAAVDGLDALTRLRTEPFDLVVSDVEMPRLNGFDLTAKIRADDDLARIPVVLVTALGSREDRERGAEAGANAYIVKGSFDQSNLLDAVRRLA